MVMNQNNVELTKMTQITCMSSMLQFREYYTKVRWND